MKIEIEVESVKALREHLCVAQVALITSFQHSGFDFYYLASQEIDKLISELDRHRPRGKDGVHGDLHTATCGCEDKPEPVKEICTCGCGKKRSTVVNEIKWRGGLNEDQAEAKFAEAQEARRKANGL